MKPKHTRLLVKNYTECFNFYKDILGFTVIWGDENSSYADIELGDFGLALFDRKLMAQAVGKESYPIESKAMDNVCLIFQVDNVDNTYSSLKEKGVRFINAPVDKEGWGMRVAHFTDPDGTLIEICQLL